MAFEKKNRKGSAVVLLQRVREHKLHQARELRKNMTPAEEILWEQVRRNRLYGFKFRRQQIIEGFIADFFSDEARCVIEVDGSVHNTPERKKADAHRTRVFAARGLNELRFTNDEVINCTDKVVETICGYLKQRIGMAA